MSVEEHDKKLRTDYIYDLRGVLKDLDIYTDEGLTKVHYELEKPSPTIIIEHPKLGVQKRVSYKDERGKIIEELIYHNDVLARRIIFSYTSFDSLMGRNVIDFYKGNREHPITAGLAFVELKGDKYHSPRHMKYVSFFNKQTNTKRKFVKFQDDTSPLVETFYTYDTASTLIKIRTLDHEQKTQQTRWFAYNKKGMPTFERQEILKNETLEGYKVLEYSYKEGSLWKVTSQSFDANGISKKQEKVFKEGLLVSVRQYEGDKLMESVDYQYNKE